MNTMKTFRVPRDLRAPAPFQFVFEVPVVVEETDESGNTNTVTTDAVREETRVFHARQSIPGGVMLDVQLEVQNEDLSDPLAAVRQVQAMHTLLQTAIVEFDEFWELLHDNRLVIDPGMLGEVLAWIAEQASNRPTS